MVKQSVYKTYSDPGHGWIVVKRAEVIRLGLLEKLTPYSYQRGDSVYIEEDGDAAAFCDAKKAHGEEFTFKHHNTNNRSRIRSYAGYNPGTGKEWVWGRNGDASGWK